MEHLHRLFRARDEKLPAEDRIVMLSDGVFAIAITLLVLDIRLPEVMPKGETVLDILSGLLPRLFSFFLSFVLVSVYWVSHRRLMHILKHINDRFIKLNLYFLFLVVLLPVTTSFIGVNYSDPQHMLPIIYTLSLAACGLFLAIMWTYALWNRRLIDPETERWVIIYTLLRSFIAPAIIMLSIALYIWSIPSSFYYLFWLLIPISYRALKYFYYDRHDTAGQKHLQHLKVADPRSELATAQTTESGDTF